jgi:hypothetical protein
MIFLNPLLSVFILFAVATFGGMVIGVFESVVCCEPIRPGEMLPERATDRAIEGFIVAAVLGLGVLISCDHLSLAAILVLGLVCGACLSALQLLLNLAIVAWHLFVLICRCLYYLLNGLRFCCESLNAFLAFLGRSLWRCFSPGRG